MSSCYIFSDLTRDEKHESVVATLGRGDYFGEIALVKKILRTATVTAISEVRLLSLDRVSFNSLILGKARIERKVDLLMANR